MAIYVLRMSALLFGICILFIPIGGAHRANAQIRIQENCNLIPEAIERLYAPRLGTYSLWDIIEGQAGNKEIFHDFISLTEKEILLAGSQETNLSLRPIIKKMNRKGRVLWQWQDKNSQGRSRPIEIIEMISEKDRFWAIGQLYQNGTPHALWFGLFDQKGGKIREHTVREKNKNLSYAALVKSINGSGWLLAVTEKTVSSAQQDTAAQSYGRFIHLNQSFEQTDTYSFMPGPRNHVYDLIQMTDPLGRNFYISVGEIILKNGQSAGLVLRLNDHGGIVWQRTYMRGAGLRFTKVRAGPKGDIYALGEAQPINQQAPKGAVLMNLDSANGTEFWQRYYMRDDIAYSGQSLLVEETGRSHILLQGIPDDHSDIQNHARMMTLSPRGQIIGEAGYTAGKGVIPLRLRKGIADLPMIAGHVTVEEPAPENPENKRITSQKGWLLVGEGFGKYKDPCMIEKRTF